MVYVSASLSLILPLKPIESPHFLGVSGIGVKIKSIPKCFDLSFEIHRFKVRSLILEF